MEQYNQWYWKLYRWCKFELKYQPKYFMYGVKNLWRWFWVIWKDRDWDHHYFWEVLKKKVVQLRDEQLKDLSYSNSAREVEIMNTVLRLIDKVQHDEYRDEYYDYYDTNMRIDEKGHLQFDEIRNDLKTFISKYPRTHKIVLNNPKYNKYLDGDDMDYKIGIAMSSFQHNKAKKLLFKLLENRIEYWWT